MNQIVTHLVLTIVMCLIPSIALTQNTSEHFKFMGIPIDGTYENFVQKLKLKGFKQFGDLEIYKGVFDNDTVLIGVENDKELNLVYAVQVIKIKDIIFAEYEAKLYPKFDNLVDRLENKYHSEAIEWDDNKHFVSIPINRNNKYVGNIAVRIGQMDSNCLISMTYYDVLNFEKHKIAQDKDL